MLILLSLVLASYVSTSYVAVIYNRGRIDIASSVNIFGAPDSSYARFELQMGDGHYTNVSDTFPTAYNGNEVIVGFDTVLPADSENYIIRGHALTAYMRDTNRTYGTTGVLSMLTLSTCTQEEFFFGWVDDPSNNQTIKPGFSQFGTLNNNVIAYKFPYPAYSDTKSGCWGANSYWWSSCFDISSFAAVVYVAAVQRNIDSLSTCVSASGVIDSCSSIGTQAECCQGLTCVNDNTSVATLGMCASDGVAYFYPELDAIQLDVFYDDGLYMQLNGAQQTGTYIAMPSNFPGTENYPYGGGVAMPALDRGGFTGNVVIAEPPGACPDAMFTNAPDFAGNVVYFDEVINTQGCEDYQRVYFAQLYGATAVIIGSNDDVVNSVMLGYEWWGAPLNANVSLITIPSVKVARNATLAIKCLVPASVTVGVETSATRANRDNGTCACSQASINLCASQCTTQPCECSTGYVDCIYAAGCALPPIALCPSINRGFIYAIVIAIVIVLVIALIVIRIIWKRRGSSSSSSTTVVVTTNEMQSKPSRRQREREPEKSSSSAEAETGQKIELPDSDVSDSESSDRSEPE